MKRTRTSELSVIREQLHTSITKYAEEHKDDEIALRPITRQLIGEIDVCESKYSLSTHQQLALDEVDENVKENRDLSLRVQAIRGRQKQYRDEM